MPRYKHGDGSLFLRKKIWWFSFYCESARYRESAKTTDKSEARKRMHARMSERERGIVQDRHLTVSGLGELVAADYRANGFRSLAGMQAHYRKHLVPYFKARPVTKITTADLTGYIVHRQQQGAKNGSLMVELSVLRRGFSLARLNGKLASVPVFPHLKVSNARVGFFERADFEAVLAKLPEHYRPPISFAYQVGWRLKAEILPLRWEQVDLDHGSVRLDVGSTKNKGGRLIYLPTLLRSILEQQWQEHLTHYPSCPLVFHRDGERIKDVDYVWPQARQAAGIPGKVPHDFRRTAVRNMVRAGIPERVAMLITGHKTRQIFDRYHIVSDTDLKEAAAKLDAAFLREDGHKFRHADSGAVDQVPLSIQPSAVSAYPVLSFSIMKDNAESIA